MGTQEVELECSGEKSAVDGSDPVCSFMRVLSFPPSACIVAIAGRRAPHLAQPQAKIRQLQLF